MRGSLDCFCTAAALRGDETWCLPCLAAAFVTLRREHPDTFSISMARRRIPNVEPHEAALGVEMSKLVLTDSVAHTARRNGRRDGARYVEHSPTARG